MSVTVNNTKYFYPPRPGNGAGTFSDNIVGLQTVDGGGLTQGNFDFTTNVVEKVNRTFNVGAFAQGVSLDDLNISDTQGATILEKQFRVYPNYDISQVLNFSMYGSLAKRFSVSVTRIINYFPASLDVLYNTINFITGNTAVNISYNSIEDETYFEINVDKIHNPFGIDYTVSASTNLVTTDNDVSEYRNLYKTYLDYALIVNGGEYKVLSFSPSPTLSTGSIAFYVSGAPFGFTATTSTNDLQIRPNDYIVDKVFSDAFDEVEKFMLNRFIEPPYTAVFQVPQQDVNGQYYIDYENVTWPKDGVWNLDIRTFLFDGYLSQLQTIAENLDQFKTNLISRFLTSDSLKEFDTLGRKVEKVFQIYGRSFDQIKQFIDGLAFMNSVNYNPENDIPSELLVDLAQTLGFNSNFSPITNEDFLSSVFGNQVKSTYPGFARAQTPTELNYAFYRNLILNAAYLFKSKGTRRSIEFLLKLIGTPDAVLEYNEHIYLADQKVSIENFNTQFAKISGGTYVDSSPKYLQGTTYKLSGVTYTAFTTVSSYYDVNKKKSDYPIDSEGYPKAPKPTDSLFFQKGAGWYESTPQNRSPEEVIVTGNVFTGQNFNVQTKLKPFTYGQDYLDYFRKFPYINDGFKLERVIDNNKSWLSTDNKLRTASQGDYNAYYYVDNEKLVLNVKNIDLCLNPSQGILYDVWVQSSTNNYPIPNTGLTINYHVPGGIDSTFINPEPNKKTFFEFSQTFWQNTINVRNRQYITDGKTGGYATLQSIFWKYIEQETNIGIPNNHYTYQKLIDYVSGMGQYWMKLVDQMIPASTIWNGGVKYENSIFHRQKASYRRQRGCQLIPDNVKSAGRTMNVNILPATCTDEYVQLYIYPWLNGGNQLSNFSSILFNRVNNFLTSQGTSISECNGISTLSTSWYVDLRAGDEILIQENFFNSNGINGVPSNSDWKAALIEYLPLINPDLIYFLDGDVLTIKNNTCQAKFLNQTLTLNVGIEISVTC
jgi:hypothetical protein